MRKSTKLFGALAVAGLVAAGGSAFTAANIGQDATKVMGYSTTTVSGATVTSLTYNKNTPLSNIDSITLVLDGDTTLNGETAYIGFNTDAPLACKTGVYDAATSTTYTCDAAPGPTATPYTQAVSGLVSTNVLINN